MLGLLGASLLLQKMEMNWDEIFCLTVFTRWRDNHIPVHWNKLQLSFDALQSPSFLHRYTNERGFPLQALWITYLILAVGQDNFLMNIWLHHEKDTNREASKLDVCHCTFLQFSDRSFLQNILLLSSVVRAMQGLMVMPGSMALDKDLGKAEQDKHQTTPH